MNCNLEIHDEFKNMGEIYCPFCYEQFENRQSNECKRCCDNVHILLDRGYSVCKNCGQVACYEVANEYVDFRENLYCMRTKNVYNRKYHLQNIIDDLLFASKIKVYYQQRAKINRIFATINKILSQINWKRKRIITMKYLLEQILDLMKLDHSQFVTIKSKQTLALYKLYWKSIVHII